MFVQSTQYGSAYFREEVPEKNGSYITKPI